jgi:two-component system, NarL family, response regulator DegU
METLFVSNSTEPRLFRGGASEAIKTLLYSSHPLVIKAMKGMLREEPSVNVLGYASSIIEMMLKIHKSDPSLVIMNEDETGGNERPAAIESIRQVLYEFPKLNILMIMSNTDYEKEFTALKTGIMGVLSGDFESDVLLECVHCVARGGLWYRRKVMEKFIREQLFLSNLKENGREEFKLPTFTRRELEIIQLAGNGIKNREIGRHLFISEKTVKHHMSRIFKKLKIKRRAELRKYL